MKVTFDEDVYNIATTEGPHEVIGVIGVGSGLGYHIDGEGHYVLDIIESGRSVAPHCFTENEQVMKSWLKRVALLLDFTQPAEQLKAQAREKYTVNRDLFRDVEHALILSLHEPAEQEAS